MDPGFPEEGRIMSGSRTGLSQRSKHEGFDCRPYPVRGRGKSHTPREETPDYQHMCQTSQTDGRGQQKRKV